MTREFVPPDSWRHPAVSFPVGVDAMRCRTRTYSTLVETPHGVVRVELAVDAAAVVVMPDDAPSLLAGTHPGSSGRSTSGSRTN